MVFVGFVVSDENLFIFETVDMFDVRLLSANNSSKLDLIIEDSFTRLSYEYS